ncbi:unannotated protein [freshwater metagenome]|uniref:Unannotated protein n=1 Tax=freshwater metagenome TaxID=449393 RepID=A0A6J6B9K0_9ZZZZ
MQTHRLVEQVVDLVFICHVHLNKRALEFLGRRSARFWVHVADDDGRTFRAHALGGRKTDSARAAGNDRDLAFQALGEIDLFNGHGGSFLGISPLG